MTGKQRKFVGAFGFAITVGLVIFAFGWAFHDLDTGLERGMYAAVGAAFGYMVGWRECLGNVAIQMRRLRG